MRAVVLALLLSMALPLSAQLLADLRVAPTEVTVFVGETTTVTAYAILGCCSNFPWRVTFGTSSWHADAEGLLQAPRITTKVRITGRAPGTTTLVSPTKGEVHWPLATIHVLCGAEGPTRVPLVSRPRRRRLAAAVRDRPRDRVRAGRLRDALRVGLRGQRLLD